MTISRIVMMALLAFTLSANAAIIRVDSASAASSPDGSSWAAAFPRLQQALAAAVSGDTIWVARGTYYTDTLSQRTASFVMKRGVAIFGGFSGTESALSGRNWRTNRTALDGDIGTRGSAADNAYHVVVGADSALIDGFLVVNGNASASYDSASGAGMLCSGTSPTVRNCVFRGNHATQTGSGSGGGLYSSMFGHPTIDNCWFDSNSAEFGGGCSLAGGLDTVTNSVFTNNSASQGGGMSNGVGAVVVNCVFYRDSAGSFGGAMSVSFNNPVISQCTFFSNRISNGNGGAAISIAFCNPSVNNSILWDGGNTEFYQGRAGDSPVLNNCCTRGGPTTYGCINTYPVFADTNFPSGQDAVWGTVDDGLGLVQSSPCVNAGANGYQILPVDITGGPRIRGQIVDMGAYEYRGTAKPWICGVPALSMNEDDTLNIHPGLFVILDSNDVNHSLIVDTGANYSVIKVNDTLVRIVPALNYNGPLSVPVRVYDAHDTSAAVQAAITVLPVDDPPVFVTNLTSDTAWTLVPYRLALSVTDPDDIWHTYQLLQAPAGMAVTGDTLSYTPAQADSGNHTVSVRVSDGILYDTLTYTLVVRVTIPPAPSAPALVFPANAGIGLPVSLSLVWNKVGTATSYYVQVATDTGFTSLFAQDSTLIDSVKAITGLANSTVYYWRVRAKNAGGSSAWTGRWSFTTIIAAPSAPVLVFPVNGDTNTPVSVSLAWNMAGTATSYYVQVATDTGFTSLFTQDSMVIDTQKLILGLANGTTYYWRARAKNAGGSSVWTSRWSFTTIIAAAGSPTLVSPASMAINLPVSLPLVWNKIGTATSYTVQVAIDTGFASLFTQDSTLTDSVKAITGLVNSTVYYWRVRAKNAGGSSAWSGYRSFTTIVAAPGAPTLVSPVSLAIDQPVSLSLVWNKVATATGYYVQVAIDTGFTSLFTQDSTLIDSVKAITGLANGTVYYWRVRAKNVGGVSAWTSRWSFTTIIAAPSVPVLVSPVNGDTDKPVSLSLVWNKVSAATNYYVQVAIDTGFASLFTQDSTLTDSVKAITGLANSTVYYWRVRAKNAGGSSAWTNRWSLTTIIAAPQAPALVSPADGDTNVPVTPTLKWSRVNFAATYHIQIATDTGFASLFLQDSTLTDTIRVIVFDSTTKYYWRVRAKNAGGAGAWSEVRSFKTNTTAVLPYARVLPHAFSISGSSSIVRYGLPVQCHVSLKYYDLRGRVVATLVNSTQAPGYYTLSIKGVFNSRGTYVRVFEAGTFVKRELAAIVGK